MSIASLLIVRLSALGDAIHVLPALSALRAALPDAKLGWAVEEKASGLLAGHPQLDRVHLVRRREWQAALRKGGLLKVAASARRTIAELRAERYDVTLDFQSNFRSGLLTYLAKSPRRIGQPPPHSKEGSGMFYTEVPEAVPYAVHKIERNLELLRPLGLYPEVAPRGVLGRIDTRTLDAALGPRDAPRVVIHGGVSAAGHVKAWREERFARLGAALAADGFDVLYVWGGQSEGLQADRLVAAASGTRKAPPTESILELAHLLSAADLFIGVDSGPLHLAAGQGTPVLGLYGPKHPGTYGPYWPGTQVVRSDEHCSPCLHRRCPRPDAAKVEVPGRKKLQRLSPCMETLTVDMALAAARSLLSGSKTREK